MEPTKKQLQKLKELEEKEDWVGAIAHTRILLRPDPEDHWLLTRLGSSYYEARQYRRALHYVVRALKFAPHCSLVLWDYAGTLDMLGRSQGAIRIWKRLLRRGLNRIAYCECGEGKRSAESLLNDCRYSIGLAYGDLAKKGLARRYLRSHLAHRRRGLPSLYSRRQAERKLAELL